MNGLLNWKSAPIEPLLMDYQQLEGAYKSTGPLSNFRGGGVGKERERESKGVWAPFSRAKQKFLAQQRVKTLARHKTNDAMRL